MRRLPELSVQSIVSVGTNFRSDEVTAALLKGRELPELPVQHQSTELTLQQRRELRRLHVKTMVENELYLEAHPELSELLFAFLAATVDMLQDQQSEHNLLQFAGQYFTQEGLREVVESKIREAKAERHQLADLPSDP